MVLEGVDVNSDVVVVAAVVGGIVEAKAEQVCQLPGRHLWGFRKF